LKKQIEQKKSAVDLTALAVGIVILGIAVSIGAVILKNVANSQITNAATYQIANESVVPTMAGTALTKTWVKSIDQVYNVSNGFLLSNTNYTLSVNSDNGVGSLSNSTCKNATFVCDNWKATYTVYNTSDPRYLLPSNATIGLSEYGNWFKILVIVGVSAVVLALIFMAFGKGTGEAETGGSMY
jgi:hypothetical protein